GLPPPFGPGASLSPGPSSTVTSRRIGRSSRITVAPRRDAVASTFRMMGLIGGRCREAAAVLLLLAFIFVTCTPEPPATDPVSRGRQLYRSLGCANCHEPNLFGQRNGPPLDRIGTVAATRVPGLTAEEYIRQSIPGPGAYVVPGYTD